MKTVGKALLWSLILGVLLIALPLLIFVVGVALPIVLTLAALILIPLLIGMILGKNAE